MPYLVKFSRHGSGESTECQKLPGDRPAQPQKIIECAVMAIMVVLAIHGGAGGDGPWKGQTDLDPAH